MNSAITNECIVSVNLPSFSYWFHLSSPLSWILTDRSAHWFVWPSLICHRVELNISRNQYLNKAKCISFAVLVDGVVIKFQHA